MFFEKFDEFFIGFIFFWRGFDVYFDYVVLYFFDFRFTAVGGDFDF